MYLFKVLQRLSNLLNLQLFFQFSSKRISCCPRFSSLDCQSIYVCPHVRAPLPSFCHNHYPIFEAHYHCQIMIIASVFDIRQPKWRLSIVDCLRHCWHTHTLSEFLSESSDNNHESIRFSFWRTFQYWHIAPNVFGQFYRHFANAQSIFANQTRRNLTYSTRLPDVGRRSANRVDDAERLLTWE